MLETLWNTLTPFLWGGALALALNVPLKAAETHLGKLKPKPRRIAALTIVLAGLAAVVVLGGWLLAPQLGAAIYRLTEVMPQLPEKLSTALGLDPNDTTLAAQRRMLESTGTKGMEALWQGCIGALRSAAGAVGQGFIALVLAIYLLAGKEGLSRRAVLTCRALFGEVRAARITGLTARAARVFSGFVAGQAIEACILAGLFLLVLLLFRMPYALPIAAVIGVTALVPVFGAWVGCAVGALLVVPVSLEKTALFLILFLAVQQFENNVIYPRVVGGRIGLPPIWVLAAVLLGGGLFGVAGLILGIPAMSVLYHVGGEWVRARTGAKSAPRAGHRP